MKGWKTWVAAAGVFGTGASMIAAGILSDPLDPDKIWQGALTCSGALAMVGFGHKIEKATKEIKDGQSAQSG